MKKKFFSMFAIVGLVSAIFLSFSLLTACSDDDDDSTDAGSDPSDNTVPSDSIISDPSNGYEYVDLGLSSGNKWATCNIGAGVPDDYGNYFAWGDTATKSSYNANSCSAYGVQISTIQGSENYDAATAIWAGDWVIPQLADWVELANECTWKGAFYGDDGEVQGVFVTGPNGNSIFLPFAGYMDESSSAKKDTAVYYWSAATGSSTTTAYYFMSNAAYETDTTISRFYGMPIRPVMKGSSDNTATQINNKYENNYESVDLGLSVKWATFNLGANSPERYGDYFAWGETDTKSDFSLNNSTTYEVDDIEDFSGDENYDAATALWGNKWRMPTIDECEELIENCTWEWGTYEQTAVKGYTVTGSNDNSIFLPAAGNYLGSSREDAGEDGHYWSSTPDAGDGLGAYLLFFNSDSQTGEYHYARYLGRSVRPVAE